MSTILVIDDEDDIREILAYNLSKEGYKVLEANNGKQGISIANSLKPDLIILDVMMPEMDGIEVCEILRKNPQTEKVLICMLTARGEDYSQIAGFNAGADDYVAKPIKPKVLISRINAMIRRSELTSTIEEEVSEQSGLIIDRDKYLVIIDGSAMQLPRKEFELLALLKSKPGNVFERDVILENVWGKDIVVGDRTIDVHVRKLREKIGPNYIKTIKGVGYKFISND